MRVALLYVAALLAETLAFVPLPGAPHAWARRKVGDVKHAVDATHPRVGRTLSLKMDASNEVQAPGLAGKLDDIAKSTDSVESGSKIMAMEKRSPEKEQFVFTKQWYPVRALPVEMISPMLDSVSCPWMARCTCAGCMHVLKLHATCRLLSSNFWTKRNRILFS